MMSIFKSKKTVVQKSTGIKATFLTRTIPNTIKVQSLHAFLSQKDGPSV
ncbi:hypothetical protein HGH93_30275 [Chitinophaga polysaccharea]|nr:MULTISPECIES: hypothetical protein [Chitinophaga]NLR62417.1 hypothetical protein [Chitinophaga polysaccharea]NLU92413.1 hypothetical protein [Chitinophaga sp. Ak27]